MMRIRRWHAVPLVLTVVACTATSVDAQTAEDVDAAVARGAAFLWSQQRPDGSFPINRSYPGGNDVCAMAALIYAREPFQKPEMVKAFKVFTELDLEHTYTLGLRLIALAERYRQTSAPGARDGLRKFMKRDALELAGFQHDFGAWGYPKPLPQNAQQNAGVWDWDFSNTQIAILGLQQAVSCGVELKPDVFLRARQFYLEKQRPDGGWNYSRAGRDRGGDDPSYGSMTAAAVANLFLIRDLLDPSLGCPCRGNRSARSRDAKVQDAIDQGVQWLGDKYTLDNPACGKFISYWHYSVERVGMATGFKYLGTHDWYGEGARMFLQSQRGDGAWSDAFGPIADTAATMLFLIKGRGPILMNKVKYDGQWNLHPRDVANLAEYVGESKEQTFLWQVIHLGVPVEELHDAPILYLTTEAALDLPEEHKKKLRQFTDTGGTIFFEASCGNRAADTWIRKTCKELWPEWELQNVDKEHSVWSADVKIMGQLPMLQGIGDGLRTFLFYAPRDISCVWTTGGVSRNRPAFDLGGNLYAYTTDRGKIRGRLAKREIGTGKKYADQKPAAGPKKSVTVARIKHGGEWYVGQNYHPWQLLSAEARRAAGLDVREADPVVPGADVPADTSMLYLSGRARCDLDEAGAAWLKDYVARGGFLFAEAVLGDKRFDAPLRSALGAAGLKVLPLGADSPFIGGAMDGAKGYAVGQVDYTFALRPERIGKPEPLLYGIYLGEKLVGVYSPFDLMFRQTACAAWDCRGYEPDDACALAMNIALFCSAR